MRMLARKNNNRSKEKWPITILYDDREKKGRWHISHLKYQFVRKRLPVGDYTLEGYESIIAVERKSGFTEFIGNLTGKKRWKFEQYLHKLSMYKLPVLIIEENIGNLPVVFRRLKYSQLRTENIYFWLTKIMFEYKIPVVFLDCNKKEKEVFLYHLFDQLQRKADKYV